MTEKIEICTFCNEEFVEDKWGCLQSIPICTSCMEDIISSALEE
jgi:formylmethanofuran dehydrogenase subunit E